MFLMENPCATKIYKKQLHTIVKTLYEKFVNRDETVLKYSKKKKNISKKIHYSYGNFLQTFNYSVIFRKFTTSYHAFGVLPMIQYNT